MLSLNICSCLAVPVVQQLQSQFPLSKSDPFLLLHELLWLNLHLPWPLVTRKPCPWEIKGRTPPSPCALISAAVPDLRDKRGKPSSMKSVLLGAQSAPNYPAKGRTRSFVCSAAGHGTRYVQPRVLRGGSRFGMLSRTFGSCRSFCFPNNFWETVPPHTDRWDMAKPVLLSGCSLKQTMWRRGQMRKDKCMGTWCVRTVKSHTFRDALSKNKLITLTAFFPEKQ